MKKTKLLFILLLTLVLGFAVVQPLSTNAVEADQTNNHIQYDVDGDGEINYVALGDSTTNGYGLSNYFLRQQKHTQPGHVCDNNCLLKDGPVITRTEQRGGNNVGYLNNAAEAYPSLLAGKLEDQTGLDVNLLNMSISGMRPEELRLLLDREYMGDGYTAHMFFGDTNIGLDANSYFQWADTLTFNDAKGFVPEYAKELREDVKAAYGVIDSSSSFYVDYPNANNTSDLAAARISADYTYAITNADVISIGLGTNNFGTASQTTVYRALEAMFGVRIGSTTQYNYDLRDILTSHPELVDMYANFKPVLEQIVIKAFGQEIHDRYYDSVIDIVQTYTYGLFGFMSNYMESIKLIRELNPSAKIVLVPAINLEEGLKFTYNGTLIDFGNIYGKVIELANMWLATYAYTLENVSYTKIGELDLIIDEISRGSINPNILSTMTGDLADNFAGGSQEVMKQIAWSINALEYNPAGNFTGNIMDPADQQVAGQIMANWLVTRKGVPYDQNLQSTVNTYLTMYGIASTLRDAIVVAAGDDVVDLNALIEVFSTVGFNLGALIMDQNGNMDPAKLYSPEVQDLLYVYVRMMFASGAGVHPSEAGHQMIADSIFDTMESGFDPEVKLQRALEILKQSVESAFGELPSVQEVKAMIEAKIAELSVKYPELPGYIAEIEQYIAQLQTLTKEEVIAVVKQKLAEVQAKVEEILVKATSTKYVFDQDSYYVSLGDSQLTGHGLTGYKNYGFNTYVNGSAPYEIAKELFGSNAKNQYKQLSMGGFRTEDLLWILNPSFTPDEFALDYTMNNLITYGEFDTIQQARQMYVSEIQKADLITLSIGGGNVSTFVGEQIKLFMSEIENPYAMDWSRYVGQQNVQYVEQVLNLIEQGLDLAGLPAQINFLGKNVNTQELLSLVIESFVYGYVGYTVNYTALIETIKHINPSANLVIVGYFNPVRGMQYPLTLENGTTINLEIDKFTEQMMNLCSLQNLAHAVLSNEQVTYVSIKDTVTFLDEAIAVNGPVSLMTYLEAIYTNSWYTHASATGHEYIKNQILHAINADHVCVAEEDDADCSTPINCAICGHEVVAGISHTYDDVCDATCNNDGCQYVRTDIHEWTVVPGLPETCDQDGYTEHKVCNVCGTIEGYVVLPARHNVDQNGLCVCGNVYADTYEELYYGLRNGYDTYLLCDLVIAPAYTAPYGNKVALDQRGGTFYGNNHTLTIEENGDYYGIITYGGTIKDLTIDKACRPIVSYTPTEDVILDNVHVIGDVLYGFNTAEHATLPGIDLIAINSTFSGWTSTAGGFESVTFKNCTFDYSTYGYGWPYDCLVKPYGYTTFDGCTFAGKGVGVGYYLDLSSLTPGCDVIIENCNADGELITAENYTELFGEVELPGNTVEGYVTSNGIKLHNHKWVAATCTAPQTCSVCGQTEGEALPHTPTTYTYEVLADGSWVKHSICSVCSNSFTSSHEGVVAGIGNNPYTSLDAAYQAAVNGDTIKLYADVTISDVNGFAIAKEITIDFNQHTVEFTTKKAFRPTADVTFKNGTILNNAPMGRCINLRATCDVVVENMNLIASASYNTQPITVGVGSGSTVQVINSTIEAGTSGYAIILFAKADILIENSTINGWNTLYFKEDASGSSAGSTATIKNTDIYSLNKYVDSTNSNSFNVITIQADDITVTIDDQTSITVETTGDQTQNVLGTTRGFNPRNFVVTIDANITLVGDHAKLASAIPCTNTLYVLKEYASLLQGNNAEIEEDSKYVKASFTNGHVLSFVKYTVVNNEWFKEFICDECGSTVLEAYSGVVAGIGNNPYATLDAAYQAAVNGDTIKLYADVTISDVNGFAIAKEITIDFNQHTVEFTTKKAFRPTADVTFKNGTILNNAPMGRCINLRATCDVVVENMNLIASASYNTQPITVGVGSGSTVQIINSTIDAGNSGYAIIVFAENTEINVSGSLLRGFNLFYFKSDDASGHSKGSSANIVNSDLYSKNIHTGDMNTFGAIIIDDSNIEVTIDSTSSVTIETTGDQQQSLVGTVDGHRPTGNKAIIDCDITLVGDYSVISSGITCQNEIRVLSKYASEFDGNWNVVDDGTYITVETNIFHKEEILPAVAPTCTQTGLTEGKRCADCGEIYVPQVTVPVIPHDYESVVTLPTVYEQGYTTHTCSVCGDSYVDSYTDTIPAIVQVGNVQYGRMEDALANWTHNSTLTLLTNVTLTDVITLKSNEHHILNLGTYTLTAASGQHAIVITPEGVGTAARSCLTIDADTTNPGGITATGKSCIYYHNANKINDRLMITINGGVFNGSYAMNVLTGPFNNWGMVTSPLRGQGCPYVVINGGTFNAQVYLNASMLKVTGGTFHKNLTCMGDSTAHRVISGGRFYGMTMTADAAGKFTFGTEKNKQDVGVYIDSQGYLVVGGPVITEAGDKFQASTTTLLSKWYLTYSSAATYGLYYESAQYAVNNNANATITVYEGSVDLTAGKFKGKLIVDGEMTVSYLETSTYANSIEFAAHPVCKTYTETINDGVVTRIYRAKDHVAGSVVVENNVDPDCTNNGTYDNVIYCVYCDIELSRQQVTVAPLGHNYTHVVTDPTCTDQGYTTHTCSRCNDSYVDTYVPALGHSYVPVVTPETCTTDGYTTHTCSRCDHSYVDTIVPAFGHSYTSVVTPATCTTAGYTTYTCSTCNYTYTDNHVTALGHAYVAVVTDPTCTTGGYTTYTCSRCGDTYVSNYTAALGHAYVAVVTNPTCTTGGYTTYTCSRCGDSYVSNYTAALGHSYNIVVTAPTCTTVGYTTYTCTRCGYSYVADHVNALGHTIVVDAPVAPTCTQTGLTEGSHCSVCNTVLVPQQSLPAKGHTYTSVVTPATCTTEGYTTTTCSVCGDTFVSNIVPAKGHTVVADPAVPATCTQTGLTKGSHCSVCNTVIVAQTVVPALGHSSVVLKAVAPTCTETGLTEGSKCSVCNVVLVPQTVVPALGHAYDSVVTAPTCTTEGYTTHTCANCEHSYTDSKVPALGHTLTHVSAMDPTCKDEGTVEHWHCSVCNKDFADAAGSQVVSNVKVPVSSGAHVDADGDNHCDACDKRIAKKSCRKGSVFTFFSFILTTVASCFVLVRRKR